ncbi:MAG TPA: hypothetical protein VJQ57_15310, partial [Acidimicrobiia bacterium]|nr:hypothetical protein [Acidimicrobiia bacterium]
MSDGTADPSAAHSHQSVLPRQGIVGIGHLTLQTLVDMKAASTDLFEDHILGLVVFVTVPGFGVGQLS